MEIFKLETFAQHLNSKFLIKLEQANASVVETELVEVESIVSTPTHEQFSLTFRGPLNALLPQSIYRFEHAALGEFDMFIVPIRQDQNGFYYEAVFANVIQPT